MAVLCDISTNMEKISGSDVTDSDKFNNLSQGNTTPARLIMIRCQIVAILCIRTGYDCYTSVNRFSFEYVF